MILLFMDTGADVNYLWSVPSVRERSCSSTLTDSYFSSEDITQFCHRPLTELSKEGQWKLKSGFLLKEKKNHSRFYTPLFLLDKSSNNQFSNFETEINSSSIKKDGLKILNLKL